jgi:hypothetical protein
MNSKQILQLGGGIARLAGRTAGATLGLFRRAAPKPGMDDVTLARKVETEIFREADAPKGEVDVNAVDGVVWLRGEVKHPDDIRGLEERVRTIPEVRGVENLLHLPKTPAPTRADTPPRQRRTRSSTRRPTPKRRTTGRVTNDRTDAIEPAAEPSPARKATGRQGRTPAPLGSKDAPPDRPA